PSNYGGKADAGGQQRHVAAHVRPSHNSRNGKLARVPNLPHQGRLHASQLVDRLVPTPGDDRAGLDTCPGHQGLGGSPRPDATEGGRLRGSGATFMPRTTIRDAEPRYGLGLSIATPRTGTDSADPSSKVGAIESTSNAGCAGEVRITALASKRGTNHRLRGRPTRRHRRRRQARTRALESPPCRPPAPQNAGSA